MAYNYPFKTTDEPTKLRVWAKGEIVPDKGGKHWDPAEWRYDICGKKGRWGQTFKIRLTIISSEIE